jgi:drug/metabolite transporter (DMT)-like permease
VRDFLSLCAAPALWALFFGTTVYGHVALKVAVSRAGEAGGHGGLLHALAGFWGWSACLAWGASCLLWALVLSRHQLTQANALSALRYPLVSVAAVLLLGERMTLSQGVGLALIVAGVALVK